MGAKKSSSWFRSHRALVFVAVFLIVAAVVIFAAVAVRAPDSQKAAIPPGGKVSLEGTLICLPHKDTRGPQTLECAIGLKSREVYYALKSDTSDESQLMSIPFNETVSVSGTLQYQDNELYQAVGTITVSDISQE